MKLVLMALMGLFFATELLSQEQPAPSTEAPSTEEPSSRRRSEAPSSGSRTVLRTMFQNTDDCETDDCPCCIFLSNDSLGRETPRQHHRRVMTTVCKRDHNGMDNVDVRWGTAEELTIGDEIFQIYNSDRNQRTVIRQALEVLPAAYLQAVSENIRIGNPNNGSKNAPGTGRVGGGSRRCSVSNPAYEYIIIHPRAFERGQSTDPRMTILHEVGHFVDREYGIAESLLATHRAQFTEYMDHYRGDSRGNDEVIAQGIMCYFFRKHFRSRLFTTELENYEPDGPSLFPQWLLDIIEADIESRS